MATQKKGGLTRGHKVVVMTQAQWSAHPARAIHNGKPGLSDGIKPWINVQFNG